MPGPDRLSILAPLPPHGEWRRALALERGAGAPRRVVLSFAPPALLDDPERLAALVRDVEAAGRLHHPGAMPVLGTETLDDQLAVVEPFRPGASVRALLDGGGRLPPDVAARLVVDACAAVARAHAIDAGEGRVLVHGGIGPSRILVGEDGAALVSGFGAGGGGTPAADVRALAAVLFECLAGEPPGDATSLLQLPGIPAALAEAVVRALGSGGAYPSPAALAQAIAGAGPLASHADVAAYADVVLPHREDGEGPGSALERGQAEVIAEDVVVEPTDPAVVPPAPVGRIAGASPGLGTPVEPTFEPLPRPPATRPGSDPAGVFAAPAPPAPRSRLPLAMGVVCLLVGFAGGFAAARAGIAPRRFWEGLPTAEPAAQAGAPAVEAAPELAVPLPDMDATAAPDEVPTPPSRPSRAATRRTKASAKSSTQAAKAAGPAPGATAIPAAKGFLDVTAPAGSEVFLDGRRVGIGGVRVEIPVGRHLIEVRLGDAKVEQAFDLSPGETWTYAVTPTPP